MLTPLPEILQMTLSSAETEPNAVSPSSILLKTALVVMTGSTSSASVIENVTVVAALILFAASLAVTVKL